MKVSSNIFVCLFLLKFLTSSQLLISFLTLHTFLHSVQIVSAGRRKFSADLQLVFRLIEGLIFISFMAVLITLIAVLHITFRDIIVCILAFMPTGWGLLLVSTHHPHKFSQNACKPVMFLIIFVAPFPMYTLKLADCSSAEALGSTCWYLGIC